jgi:hypothetical protein
MLLATELLGFFVFAVVVGWALTQRTRARSEVVTLTVSSVWALDQQCRAIGHLLTEAPGLRRVEIELGELLIADRSTISLLTYTHRRLEDADVTLSIVASPAVIGLLIAGGLGASMKEAEVELPARIGFPN